MTFLEAALQILRREGKPLHFKDITDRAVTKKLLSVVGRTPDVTMQLQLQTAVKKAPGAPFVRVKPGVFGLLRYPDPGTLEPEEPAVAPAAVEKDKPVRADKADKPEKGEDARGRRGRRGRRGGGRPGRDEAVSPAPAVAQEAGAPVDDELDEPSEPVGSAMSAEARAAALAESGVLAGGNDSDDDDDLDDEDQAVEQDADESRSAGQERAQDQTVSAAPVAASPADEGSDEGDDDEDDEGEEIEAGAEGAAPGLEGDGGLAGRRRRRRRRRRGRGEGGFGEGAAGEQGAFAGPGGAGSTLSADAGGGSASGGDASASGDSAPSSDSGASAGGEPRTTDAQPSAGGGRRIMSPIDAAIEILRGQAPGRGVHVRHIADAGVRRRLIHGEPHEAWRVVRAALAAEPRERLRAGQRPRIKAAGSGLFALARRPPDMDLEKAEHVFGEARRALRERTAAALEQRLVELGPGAFEALVRVLLQREGFGPATFVKRVEGTVYLESLRGRGWKPSKCLVGLRSGSGTVGRRSIGELRAGVRARNMDEGVLVLAARLGEDAINEWKQAGPPVEVIDGPALAETCIRHGVGVINATVSVDFVDADFFAELSEG